jgi:hypothetical protein
MEGKRWRSGAPTVWQGHGEIKQLRSRYWSRKTDNAEDRICEFQGLETGIKVIITNTQAKDLAG